MNERHFKRRKYLKNNSNKSQKALTFGILQFITHSVHIFLLT